MTVFDESAPTINEAVSDHACFGCGSQNPIGLGLQFRRLPDGRVWTSFTPAKEYEGYFGMTHGGIISTVLDEVMSWAITVAGEFGVTARMSVTFRQPARVGHPLRAIGEVTGRRGRAIETVPSSLRPTPRRSSPVPRHGLSAFRRSRRTPGAAPIWGSNG